MDVPVSDQGADCVEILPDRTLPLLRNTVRTEHCNHRAEVGRAPTLGLQYEYSLSMAGGDKSVDHTERIVRRRPPRVDHEVGLRLTIKPQLLNHPREY